MMDEKRLREKMSQIKIACLRPIVVVLITLGVCLYVMALYLQGPLQGNFNQFFMPAQMFGVPADLRAHGIQELYTGPVQTGWDGQFYYYIANDPLALKDTPAHIDFSAYRYQRIGLPLLTYVVSKMTGQPWVSPLTYYLTSLCVILLAVGRAAFFFQRQKINPTIILCWSLACGTLVTQLNGLPDAAADGFLIIALISLVERQCLIAMFVMIFAALSREIYVLLPVCITFCVVIGNFRIKGIINFFNLNNVMNLLKQIIIYLIPIIIMLGWQIFLRYKFSGAALSQPDGMLNWPFVTAFHYISAGLSGYHPKVGAGRMAYLEGFGVILYLTLLMLSLFIVLRFYLFSQSKKRSALYSGIALFFVLIIVMYVCFGPMVMMHHTGYFKAVNIFLFIIPFLIAVQHKKINFFTMLFLLFLTCYFNYFLWDRVHAIPYHETPTIHYALTEPACLQHHDVKLALLSTQSLNADTWLKRLLLPREELMTVKITNSGQESFSPFPGKGGVNMSYQWVRKSDGAVVRDGVRTFLIDTLASHQSITLPVYVYFPRTAGDYFLNLSLVQEGCAWFYLADPKSALRLCQSAPYIIHLTGSIISPPQAHPN